MLKLLRRAFRFLGFTAIAMMIVLALLTVLLRLGSPFVSTYKEEIENWVSDYLQSPVEIGQMSLTWSGFRPALSLQQVSLRGDGEQVDLGIEKMALDLDLFRSATRASLQINQVSLQGVDLTLEYLGATRFRFRGRGSREAGAATGVSAGDDRDSLAVAAWLLNAREVSLLDSRLNLVDQARGIDYEFTDLDIHASNRGDAHELLVESLLPQALGEAVSARAKFTGDASSLLRSAGEFDISFEGLNLVEWMPIWPGRQVHAEGVADLQIGGRFDGRLLEDLHAAVSVHALSLAPITEQPARAASVQFDAFDTNLTWTRHDIGWQLDLVNLLMIEQGIKSQIQRLSLLSRGESGSTQWHVSGRGSLLSLSTVAATLSGLQQLEATAALAATTARLDPTGLLRNWRVELRVDEQRRVEPTSVEFDGGFEQLAIQPGAGYPGIRRLTGLASISAGVGKIDLDSRDLAILSARMPDNPYILSSLQGGVDIDLHHPAQLLSSGDLVVRHDGMLLVASAVLGHDAQQGLSINLKSQFELGDLSRLKSMLPRQWLKPRLVAWLDKAFLAGRVSDGRLVINGPLRGLPYRQQQGTLAVAMRLDDLTLNYKPGWPLVNHAKGLLVFDGPSVRFQVEEALFDNMQVTHAEGFIDDMLAPQLVMTVAGHSTIARMLAFATEGPLKAYLRPVLKGVVGQGAGEISTDIVVPLRSARYRGPDEKLRVGGNIYLRDARVSFDKLKLAFEQVTGAVGFTEKGVDIRSLQASLDGHTIDLQASTGNLSSGLATTITASAVADVTTLLRRYRVPVADFFSGRSPLKLKLQIPHTNRENVATRLSVVSDMVGTAVDFPAPLSKTPEQTADVIVTGIFKRDGNQIWDIRHPEAQVRTWMAPENTFSSMSVFLGSGELREHVPGAIYLSGKIPEISFDGWIGAVSRIVGKLDSKDGKPRPILPVYASLDTSNLLIGQQATGAARIRVNSDAAFINAVVASSYLRGNIRYPRIHWRDDSQLYARIDSFDYRLIDALKSADSHRQQQDRVLNPLKLPAMQLDFNKVVLGRVTLEDLTLRAVPDHFGLKITGLGFNYEDAQLIGDGFWYVKDAQSTAQVTADRQFSRLNLNFQSSDLGKTLSSIGLAGTMASGHGTVETQLSWDGPFYKPRLETLHGESRIELKEGQILAMDPGAAKLIGLFAFQELPRRLSLDFRDLTNRGLEFRTLGGNITIGNGVADAEKLQLEGPVGVIEVSGRTDLVEHRFDQHIQVLPRVSAALPIIGILSGGATAGIGALLAAPVLKKLGIDFDRLGLTEYELTGGWDAPTLTKLETAESPAHER